MIDNIYEIPTALCEKIVSSFRNLLCGLDFYDDMLENFLARLNALDLRLVEFKAEELNTVSRSISGLKRLSCTVYAISALSVVAELFSRNMPHLTFLHLSFAYTMANISETMLELSNHCGTLLEFYLKTCSPKTGAFLAFGTILEHIDIAFTNAEFWEDSSVFDHRVTDAVTLFLTCPSLRRLKIYRSGEELFDTFNGMAAASKERLANLCNPIRIQNPYLHVSVFGVDYLA